VAFPLIRRILALNDSDGLNQPVEVVLLSRNDPDTCLRVFNSIEQHKLNITRAAFVSGRDPFRYLAAFNTSLFLSANPVDAQTLYPTTLQQAKCFRLNLPTKRTTTSCGSVSISTASLLTTPPSWFTRSRNYLGSSNRRLLTRQFHTPLDPYIDYFFKLRNFNDSARNPIYIDQHPQRGLGLP
jgi:hypothetical protein